VAALHFLDAARRHRQMVWVL